MQLEVERKRYFANHGSACLKLIRSMTLEETNCFKMLDEYSRSRYSCFLAEMDLNATKKIYALCFRPTEGNKNSPNRYACRYLYIGAEQVNAAGQMPELPTSVTEMPTAPPRSTPS